MVNKYLPLGRKGEREEESTRHLSHVASFSFVLVWRLSRVCSKGSLSVQTLSLEFLSALSSTVSSHLCVPLEEMLFKMFVPIDAKIRKCEKQQGVL